MINAKTYDVAVLSSPEFEPSDNKQLTFKYFRAVNGHTLKICFDTNFVTYTNKILMAQCDVAIPPLTGSNAQTWNDVAIQIPNTATKVLKIDCIKVVNSICFAYVYIMCVTFLVLFGSYE